MRGKRPTYDTKLDRWIAERDVKLTRLAEESGYSRQHLLRIRQGKMEPTRRCIKAIVDALRELTGVPVKAAELFELEE
jgi:predicted transcriptional regulator